MLLHLHVVPGLTAAPVIASLVSHTRRALPRTRVQDFGTLHKALLLLSPAYDELARQVGLLILASLHLGHGNWTNAVPGALTPAVNPSEAEPVFKAMSLTALGYLKRRVYLTIAHLARNGFAEDDVWAMLDRQVLLLEGWDHLTGPSSLLKIQVSVEDQGTDPYLAAANGIVDAYAEYLENDTRGFETADFGLFTNLKPSHLVTTVSALVQPRSPDVEFIGSLIQHCSSRLGEFNSAELAKLSRALYAMAKSNKGHAIAGQAAALAGEILWHERDFEAGAKPGTVQQARTVYRQPKAAAVKRPPHVHGHKLADEGANQQGNFVMKPARRNLFDDDSLVGAPSRRSASPYLRPPLITANDSDSLVDHERRSAPANASTTPGNAPRLVPFRRGVLNTLFRDILKAATDLGLMHASMNHKEFVGVSAQWKEHTLAILVCLPGQREATRFVNERRAELVAHGWIPIYVHKVRSCCH